MHEVWQLPRQLTWPSESQRGRGPVAPASPALAQLHPPQPLPLMPRLSAGGPWPTAIQALQPLLLP